MMNAWMPSARPSATATITTSSTIELLVTPPSELIREPLNLSRFPPASRRRVAGGDAWRRILTGIGGDIGIGRGRLGLVPGDDLVVLAPPLTLDIALRIFDRRRLGFFGAHIR